MFDEDPFPLAASINIATTNLRALLNAKKAERFSLSAKIREVWILKKYLVHMDDLAIRRRVSVAIERENNERYLEWDKSNPTYITHEKPECPRSLSPRHQVQPLSLRH